MEHTADIEIRYEEFNFQNVIAAYEKRDRETSGTKTNPDSLNMW